MINGVLKCAVLVCIYVIVNVGLEPSEFFLFPLYVLVNHICRI